MEKAEEKAKDPEFQAKVKKAAQRQATQRRRAASEGTAAPIGRRAFGGGYPGTIGYPWGPGDPLYGTYAYPGYYQDGQWYEQDSDGDGVPDSQDAAPNDPSIQTADQADQAQYGDTDADGVPDAQDPDNADQFAGEPDEPGGEAYDGGGMSDVPDAAGDTYDPGYSDGGGGGYSDGGGGYDSGGGDSGGGGGDF
jgi:hypothetical protein